MKKIAFISLLILLVSAFSACNNEEGRGGTSIVQGYVYNVIHDTKNYSMTVDTVPAAKADVFLSYGKNNHNDEKAAAAPDGFYQFKYLTKGNYTVFSYSTPAVGEKIAEEKNIKAGSGTTTVEDIYIHSGKAYETAIIKGQVKVRWWSTNASDKDYVDAKNPDGTYKHYSETFVNNLPKYASNIRVFIRYLDDADTFYRDRIVTDENGFFIFEKLQPGKYVVFAYSADEYFLLQKNIKVDKVVEKSNATIEVTETGKRFPLDEDEPLTLEIIDILKL